MPARISILSAQKSQHPYSKGDFFYPEAGIIPLRWRQRRRWEQEIKRKEDKAEVSLPKIHLAVFIPPLIYMQGGEASILWAIWVNLSLFGIINMQHPLRLSNKSMLTNCMLKESFRTKLSGDFKVKWTDRSPTWRPPLIPRALRTSQ